MKTLVFYHLDMDGICSAAIVDHANKASAWAISPKLEFRPINYGHPFPWEEIVGNDVIMVDFSLPLPDMHRLSKEAADLVWIDHHKTVLDALSDESELAVEVKKIKGKRVNGRAGCELTWQYFFGQFAMPRVVQLLGRWDVWDHKADLDCIPFQYAARLDLQCPLCDDWPELLKGHYNSTSLVNEMILRGKAILRYLKQQWAEQVAGYAFVTEIEGLRTIALNTAERGSSIFESVWDPDKHDAMLVYRWCPHAGCYTASIYTDKPGVDVGAVAASLGGGGHKGAAGFQFDEFPFKRTTVSTAEPDIDDND